MKHFVTMTALIALGIPLVAGCGHSPQAELLAGGPNATHTPLPANAVEPASSVRIKGTITHGPIVALPDEDDAQTLCASSPLDRAVQIRTYRTPDGGTVRMDAGLVVGAQRAPDNSGMGATMGVTIFAVVAPNGLAGYVCDYDVEAAS
jgi:hypothetical protein